ncbi:MAG: hypothetical protein Q7R43_03655 [Candidatus Daviesbacteria bacterium]|nr:hypothetical protein [Candidatus Daviesbacteria bacterium]
MTSQDFFLYSVGLGFLILVGFVSLSAYRLAESLKKITQILQNVEGISEDISNDIDNLVDRIKSGVLNLLHIFIKKRR